MLLDDTLIRELKETALLASVAAAEVTTGYFRSDRLGINNKDAGGFDPVTKADREAELAIRKVIEERRPADGILGEEFPSVAGETGLTWIIDPIDGTRGFMSGTPTWGTLISVGDASGPILGIIDQPYTGETFLGGPGIAELRRAGTTTPLGVRPSKELSDATIFTTFPEVGTTVEGEAFHALARQTRLTRYGMDCYAYALLAAGQIDLVVEAGLHIYDIHAPVAVIQAAGGIVTNWQGEPAHGGGRVLAAASRELHAAALQVLKRCP